MHTSGAEYGWGGLARAAVHVALLAAVGLAWGGTPAAGQGAGGRISGTVSTAEGEPIGQAQVFLATLGRGTVTDAGGSFVLPALPAGRHVVQVARAGYAPVRREVVVPAGSGASVEFTLVATPLSLPGVQVTGTTASRDPLAVAQATTHLAGGALQRELGGTLAQTLKMQPGIAMRSMGPAATMPVMRGLTGDRILVLQDGRRTADLAGSADDHGVTIDPLVVERLEVVRGPATLLYGNNALGGVVNVISGDIPGHRPDALEWEAGVQAESAQPGAAASLRATLPVTGRWVLSLRGGGRRAAEMRIPRDPVLGSRLENTRLRNWSAAAGLGYVGEGATGGAALKVYDFGYGLPVPPGAGPVSLSGRRYEGSGRAEFSLPSALFPSLAADATVQGYSHDERDDRAGEVAQTFVLGTRTANLLLRQGGIGPVTEGAWGISGLAKAYAATGPAALTPAADSRGFGLFGFQAVSLGGPALELGARLDDYRIRSRPGERFGPGRDRSFRALSGSVGVRAPVVEGVSAAVTLARSFRAPTVEELFSGAAHAGTGAVEFGDPALAAERGLSLEGVVRIQTGRVNGQVAAYRNEVAGYVHLAARGDTVLYGVRLPVLAYAQDPAVLQGVEGSVEWAATRTVVLGAMGDYLHAGQAGGAPLSFMPPPRLGLTARWDDAALFLGGDVHHELRQGRVGAAGEIPTPAHTLLRLHAGLRFHLGEQYHSLTLRVENLADELHREATSRIKDFAPGPGRSVAAVYRVRW